MDDLQPNPDGCSAFEPNAFKREQCMNCGHGWALHLGGISATTMASFAEARERAAKRAKNICQARQRTLQQRTVEDRWYLHAVPYAPAPAPMDCVSTDSDSADTFRMLSVHEVQRAASARSNSLRGASGGLKIVNLIDFGECDARTPSAPTSPELHCSSSDMSPAPSAPSSADGEEVGQSAGFVLPVQSTDDSDDHGALRMLSVHEVQRAACARSISSGGVGGGPKIVNLVDFGECDVHTPSAPTKPELHCSSTDLSPAPSTPSSVAGEDVGRSAGFVLPVQSRGNYDALRMLSVHELQRAALARSIGKAGQSLKIVNLIDFGECDVRTPSAPTKPELHCSSEELSPAPSAPFSAAGEDVGRSPGVVLPLQSMDNSDDYDALRMLSAYEVQRAACARSTSSGGVGGGPKIVNLVDVGECDVRTPSAPTKPELHCSSADLSPAPSTLSSAAGEDAGGSADVVLPVQSMDDSDDYDALRMLSVHEMQRAAPARSTGKPGRGLKVVNLVDFGECDVRTPSATAKPEVHCSSADLSAAGQAQQQQQQQELQQEQHQEQQSPGSVLPVQSRDGVLLEELALLRHMLADANEDKAIQVAAARDEVNQKQAVINELEKRHAESEAMLSEELWQAKRELKRWTAPMSDVASVGSEAELVAWERELRHAMHQALGRLADRRMELRVAALEAPAVAQCMICIERPSSCALLPCRHRAFCDACLLLVVQARKQTCPLCRVPISGLFEAHAS